MSTRSRNPLDYGHRRVVFWLVVLMLCCGAGGIRLRTTQQARARDVAWLQQIQQKHKLEEAAFERMESQLRAAFKPYRPQNGLTPDELSRLVNGGQPFTPTDASVLGSPLESRLLWVDPETKVAFLLEFYKGHWTSFRHFDRFPPPPSKPPPAGIDVLTEGWRRAFAGSFSLGWGTSGWLLLLILFVIVARYRRFLSELMLALAILCTTAWIVSPHSSLTITGLMSNDMLFWAVIMMLISTGAVALAYGRREEVLQSACTTCEYNLTGNTSGVCPECGTATGSLICASTFEQQSQPFVYPRTNICPQVGDTVRFTGDPEALTVEHVIDSVEKQTFWGVDQPGLMLSGGRYGRVFTVLSEDLEFILRPGRA